MKRAATKTTKHLRHSKRYEPMVTSHLQLKQHEQANKQASLVHMSFSISLSHSPPLLRIMKGIGNVKKVFKPQLMSYLRLQNTTFPPKTWAQHGTIGKKKQALEKKKEKKSHWHSLKCHNMRQVEWGGVLSATSGKKGWDLKTLVRLLTPFIPVWLLSFSQADVVSATSRGTSRDSNFELHHSPIWEACYFLVFFFKQKSCFIANCNMLSLHLRGNASRYRRD